MYMYIFFVKCVVDCFPVSQSTELLYSNDQFAHSYSNSYELFIGTHNPPRLCDSSLYYH